MNTITERLQHIKQGKELSLAVEGGYTNLRIWTGRDENGKHLPDTHDTVFIRLDKANGYSAPLNEMTAKYVKNAIIHQLVKYGFKSHISELSNILKLTEGLKQRDCISW